MFKPTLVIAILSLTTSTFASPVPGKVQPTANLQARYELGGLDMDRACQAQNGLGWEAVHLGDGVDDWRCRRGTDWRSVNMSAACANQYGWPEAYAKWGRSAYDWTCHLDV